MSALTWIVAVAGALVYMALVVLWRLQHRRNIEKLNDAASNIIANTATIYNHIAARLDATLVLGGRKSIQGELVRQWAGEL